MMDIEFTGNWEVAGRILRQLPTTIKSAGVYGQRRAAERLVKIVRDHINNQDLGWAPRSSKSVEGDSRVLVSSGDYYGSIRAWKNGDSYFAGVPKNSYNSKGIAIIEYALAHEYGFGSMPERPLWEPSYRDIGGKAGVQAIIKLAIKNKLDRLKTQGFE